MKIVVVGPQFPDSFAHNVSTTLEAMGHTISTLDGRLQRHNSGRYEAAFRTYLPKLFPSLETRMQQAVIERVRDLRPALVLVTYDLFSPATVEAIRQAAQAPVVCWYIDPPANLRGGGLFLCPYDAFFAKEPGLVTTMQGKLGLPAHYLPEACNPAWHRPVELSPQQKSKYECEIVAQGTAHPYRARFFENLLDFDVKIWGTPPSPRLQSASRKFFAGEFLACQEKAAAFVGGKVLLNSMNFAEVLGVNNTLFEGAGCGAFQICDDRPTLAEFFQPGEEVVTFRDRAELLDKLSYYLPRDAERKAIAQRASQRAHREHTYEKRLSSMLQTLRLR